MAVRRPAGFRHNSLRLTSRGKNWVLRSGAFEKLLLTLDPDRERAAEKYEAIRRRLVQLFQWRGCLSGETLADDTIDRVSRRLEEGEVIRASDPAIYFYGVARNVLKEYWTEQRKEQTLERSSGPVRETPAGQWDLDHQEVDERLECLDRCLAGLSRENKQLIMTYYRSEKSGKIADRTELANRLKLSAGALRIRAHRIRGQLEECVTECMGKRADG